MPLSEKDPTVDVNKVMEAAREKEAAHLTEAELKYIERIEQGRAGLAEQFEKFVADNRTAKIVAGFQHEWHNPGHIVEVFMYRKPNQAGLVLSKEALLVPTPYGKVLESSPLNEPSQRFTPGTVLHLGDPVAGMRLNPEWELWHKAQGTNQKFTTPEPSKFVKRVYAWVNEGKMFYLDKARLVLDENYRITGPKQLVDFDGPFVFELDPYEIGRKVIKGNPWA